MIGIDPALWRPVRVAVRPPWADDVEACRRRAAVPRPTFETIVATCLLVEAGLACHWPRRRTTDGDPG